MRNILTYSLRGLPICNTRGYINSAISRKRLVTAVNKHFKTMNRIFILAVSIFAGTSELQARDLNDKLEKIVQLTDSLLWKDKVDLKTVHALVNEGLTMAQIPEDRHFIPRLLENLSYAYKLHSQYDKAEYYSFKAYHYAKKYKLIEQQASSGHTLATIYIDQGRMKKCFELIYENLDLAQRYNLEYYSYANYILLASLSEYSGNTSVADYYFLKAYDFSTDSMEREKFILECSFKALVNDGKIEDAKKLLVKIRKGILAPISADDMFSLIEIGKTFLSCGQYEHALEIFLDLLRYKDYNANVYPIAALTTYTAATYIHLNNISEAEKWNKRSAEISGGLVNGYEDYLTLLKNEAKIFASKGNFRASVNIWNKINVVEDSISGKRNEIGGHFAGMLRKLEISEHKNQQIAFDNNLKDSIILEEKKHVFLLLLLVSVLTISILIVIALLRKLKKYTNNISEQKRTLSEQARELQSSNLIKDKLFSLLGHELRSPVADFLTVLRVKNTLNRYQDIDIRYLEEVHQRTESLYATLDNLLHWSSTQLQKGNVSLYKLDLSDVVDHVSKSFTEKLAEKRITLVNEIEGSCFVTSNEGHLTIVLRNLLANAIKFTPLNGVITIKISSRLSLKGIIIQDTGTGFSKDALDTVFSNVQKSSPGTEGERGTGVGLLLCKDIIDRLNGKISIESEENTGTAVEILLPDDRDENEPS